MNSAIATDVFFSFERELKNKLAQKASGSQSEETVLLKAFKYFDLNNNGTVEPDEFAKAIEKIGIMIPTRQVSSLGAHFHAIEGFRNLSRGVEQSHPKTISPKLMIFLHKIR